GVELIDRVRQYEREQGRPDPIPIVVVTQYDSRELLEIENGGRDIDRETAILLGATDQIPKGQDDRLLQVVAQALNLELRAAPTAAAPAGRGASSSAPRSADEFERELTDIFGISKSTIHTHVVDSRQNPVPFNVAGQGVPLYTRIGQTFILTSSSREAANQRQQGDRFESAVSAYPHVIFLVADEVGRRALADTSISVGEPPPRPASYKVPCKMGMLAALELLAPQVKGHPLINIDDDNGVISV